jgi:hypothetical protein
MDLEECNKRGRGNDKGEARYAESGASERISEASSLPGWRKHQARSALPVSVVSPETLNSKVLMARSTALVYTGIDDKEAREAEDVHQALLAHRAVRLVVHGPGEGD